MRYLTKSRLVLAMECPTKLFYTGKDSYANLRSDDSFLEGLAENGYQLGELARCYHPEGILIESISHDDSVAETAELLKREKVTIFEAAFRYRNMLVRADIVEKHGNSIRLTEVKSKSYDSSDDSPFMTKKGTISSTWQPYLYDVAFQKLVVSGSMPELSVTCFLMLPDRNAIGPSNGLNQKFRIVRDGENVRIRMNSPLSEAETEHPIMRKVNVDPEISCISEKMVFMKKFSFSEYAEFLAGHYENDTKIDPVPGSVCKKCEFRCDAGPSLKSGFEECWKEAFSFGAQDCKSPMILDIWNLRQLDGWIHSGIHRVSQIQQSDLNIKESDRPGLSSSERQWMQIEKMQKNDMSAYIDRDAIRDEMKGWNYPLHFIDFETIKPAIPFHEGEHPYHDIAFQFSHHVMEADGSIRHAGQYINTKIGTSPNLDFIRALKNELGRDDGTIFRYATHENTYINRIYHEIKNSHDQIHDRDELLSFMRSISQSTKDSCEKWNGERNMQDLREFVLRYYYDPLTFGSNSIKHVFPSILKRSEFLQEKFSRPVYGAPGGVPSLNFTDMQWVRTDNGDIADPYSLLPRLFQDINITEQGLDLLFSDDVVKGGGAASIAYSRLQFCEMSSMERSELTSALLKYCELDTLAMVMIVEFFQTCCA